MQQNRIVRERVAGQSAMAAVVAAQAEAPARTPIYRMLGLTPLTAASRASYRGALGELHVGETLEGLGQRWDVLHDLPLERSVLDHLVIGPAGVFAVRAANYSGTDVVGPSGPVLADELRDDLALVSAEAAEAARLLSAAAEGSIPVQPLLVVVAPRRLSPGVDARIVASRDLERLLTRAPATLSGDDVAAISDRADLASTWPRGGTPVVDTQQLRHEFETIRDDVQRSFGRRLLWGAAALGLAYGLAWGFIGSLVALIVHS